MIALRVDDGYGGAVVLTVLAHTVVVDVEHVDRMPELHLNGADLRDLARAALVAATMLDEDREVIA